MVSQRKQCEHQDQLVSGDSWSPGWACWEFLKVWLPCDHRLLGVGQQQGRFWDRWNNLFSPSPSPHSHTPTHLSPADPPYCLLWPCTAPHSFVRTRWGTISDTQQMHTQTHLCFPVSQSQRHICKELLSHWHRLKKEMWKQIKDDDRIMYQESLQIWPIPLALDISQCTQFRELTHGSLEFETT